MNWEPPFARRLTWVILVVAALNVAAFVGWLRISHLGGALLGIGVLAYLLGARHAFDVDHIAAIDNVTRRLRQDGNRPAGVGLFFSLGHATVVVAATAGLLLGGEHLREALPTLRLWGGALGAGISATFLVLIGIANLAIVRHLWSMRQKGQHDGTGTRQLEALLEQRGVMARLMRFAYRRIDRSPKMFVVGLLFGLGFDTASEVFLLALTAVTIHRYGLGVWSLIALPLLFAAGMTLMDSALGLGMLRLYDWSMSRGSKTWVINTAVTTLSAMLAFGVGAAELTNSFRWSVTSTVGLAAGFLVMLAVLVVVKRQPAHAAVPRNEDAASG